MLKDQRSLSEEEWFARMERLGRREGFFTRLGLDHSALFVDREDTLIVTFETVDSIRRRQPDEVPLGLSVCENRDWSHLCVMTRGDTWYRDPAVYGFIDSLVDDAFFDAFQQVIFFGAGMAGYAAAAYSVAAPGATVIVIQPQATLDPAVAGWDTRFVGHRRLNFNDRYGYAPDMTDGAGQVRARAFPGWATIPSTYSLADARIWHLAFAWVLAGGLLLYLPWSLANGHIRRDLHITRREWSPAHLWQDLRDHARLLLLRGLHATPARAEPVAAHASSSPHARYNTLQKIAYAVVLFGLLPLMIATGLAMSPGMDAAWPWLSAVWGGRQSARSVHFIAAFALVAFFLVHILMVLLAGPLNELRSIVTGWYRLPPQPEDQA